jgi:hypothetical protein
LGHIPVSGSPAEQMRALLNFFGVAGKKEWESIWTAPAVAFRKSAAFEANPMAVAAWLRLGERLAQQIRTDPYDQDRFIQSLLEIRKLTRAEPHVFAPQAAELCRVSGVAFVFVPELPATRVHGATRWLTPQKALLQLSLRGKTDDLLWFAFFHEAAHILKHGKREVFIEAPDGAADAEAHRKEQEADAFASDFLIPKGAYAQFRQQGPFTTERVKRFAAELGIAPGIVVGRLHYDRLLPYTHLNGLRRRLRLQAPTA